MVYLRRLCTIYTWLYVSYIDRVDEGARLICCYTLTMYFATIGREKDFITKGEVLTDTLGFEFSIIIKSKYIPYVEKLVIIIQSEFNNTRRSLCYASIGSGRETAELVASASSSTQSSVSVNV